jgi:hypothetical protein
MTPRTIAALWKIDLGLSLSELILQQTQLATSRFDLTGNAPLFEPIHPQLLQMLKQFADGSAAPGKQRLQGQSFFQNSEEATRSFAHQALPMVPWVVAKHLVLGKTPVILDCPPLGSIVFHDSPPSSEKLLSVSGALLEAWLTYALSPELWGPNGKWIRFHERLVAVFSQRDLLKGEPLVGRYELHPRAGKLENFGFFGSLSEATYTLTLPWTFPLSALVKLEKVILQEF